ncbi:MAG TPA: hypothetical protein VGL97_20220 [Bryobacteraceae bacterium]|jgi:hypothetical protein
MKRSISLLVLAVAALFGTSIQASADDGSCSANNFHSDGLVSYAETREQRLPSGSENYINPGQNGSIRVHGWSNQDVRVRACIQAAAPSEEEARTLASQVAITKGIGAIEPDGPANFSDRRWWSVSYEVWVPASSNLKMDANNGSIALDGVQGHIQVHTQNGSLRFSQVGGDVNGATTNGSVTVDLAGSGWSGDGLHLQTTNGSVNLNVPANFSARVEASTVNGHIKTDFPVTVSGEIERSLSFVLGSGGSTIEARTVNGSVHIGRRS